MAAVDLSRKRVTTTEAPWVRWTLIAIALVFLLLFLVLPLAAVFTEAFRKGIGAYLEALKEPDAWSAIRLTVITAAIAVPSATISWKATCTGRTGGLRSGEKSASPFTSALGS